MLTRALIIYNPAAGQSAAKQQSLERAGERWRSLGWKVEIGLTDYAGHATLLAREAAIAGYDLVVAAGGDGTVNEVVNGLVGTETALAVFPLGTVNIWAREMGLPMDVERSAELFVTAQRRQLDVGQAGDRYFLLMAGVGFDGAVTAQVNRQEKRQLGAIAYVKQAAQLAWNYRGRRLHLRIDGKRVRGRILMVVIGNSQLYGGVVKFTARAVVDDGLLDVCVIRGQTMLDAPMRLGSVLGRRYDRDPKVTYHQAREVSFLSKQGLPVQIDGDYLGMTPMRFAIVPACLWALVPQAAEPSLWTV